MYVNQLEQWQQDYINHRQEIIFKVEGLKGEELEQAREAVMNSKVVDVTSKLERKVLFNN